MKLRHLAILGLFLAAAPMAFPASVWIDGAEQSAPSSGVGGIIVGKNTLTNGSGAAIDVHGSTPGTNGGYASVFTHHYNAGSAATMCLSNNTAGVYIDAFTSGSKDYSLSSTALNMFGNDLTAAGTVTATNGAFVTSLTLGGVPMTAIQIVTNTDIRATTPTQQRQLVYDVTSNTLFLAEGLTTNDWIKFVGAAVP